MIGCGQDIFDSYATGLSTPSGNKIWIERIEFDDSWGVPGGGLSCCWKEIGAGASVFDKPMPRQVYLRWVDESETVVYEATLELAKDLAARARHLPGYTVLSSGRHDPGDPHLIIGMQEGGAVTVWLSNAPHGINMSGRVLHIVGTGQAAGRPWEPTRDSPPALTEQILSP
jgi:hypothetical protein